MKKRLPNVVKEFSQLNSDFLFVKDFAKDKPDHKIELDNRAFNNLDSMGVESVNIYADTSILYQQSNFLFNLAKYAEKSAYRYTDTNPNTKKREKIKFCFTLREKE